MKHLLFYLLFFIGISVFSQKNGVINIDASSDVKAIIQKRISYNKSKSKTKGYRIQIYYGSENGAIAAKSKFSELFPNTATYIEYDSPDWKVKVGNFKTKLEADKAREEILLVFDGAFVLEEKIPIY
jgi:hypothetical protein